MDRKVIKPESIGNKPLPYSFRKKEEIIYFANEQELDFKFIEKLKEYKMMGYTIEINVKHIQSENYDECEYGAIICFYSIDKALYEKAMLDFKVKEDKYAEDLAAWIIYENEQKEKTSYEDKKRRHSEYLKLKQEFGEE